MGHNREYLGQLAVYLKNCPSIQQHLKDVDYQRSDLVKLFGIYYSCVGSPLEKRKEQKGKFSYGVLGGVSITSINITSDLRYLSGANYNSSANPVVGGVLEYILPRNGGRWSFYNELAYTSFNVQGKYVDRVSDNQYTVNQVALGFSYLRIANWVRFNRKISPDMAYYFGGGVMNGMMIGEGANKRTATIYLGDNSQTTTDPAFRETKKHEIGLSLGTGLRYKAYEFGVRYESSNGFSPSTGTAVKVERIFAMLQYRFR